MPSLLVLAAPPFRLEASVYVQLTLLAWEARLLSLAAAGPLVVTGLSEPDTRPPTVPEADRWCWLQGMELMPASLTVATAVMQHCLLAVLMEVTSLTTVERSTFKVDSQRVGLAVW